MTISRRQFALGVAGAFAAAGTLPAFAQSKEIRVGFQKYGTLVLLKGKGLLEDKLGKLGYSVTWSEFAAGPQMLEALNAGALDIAQTGEAPPIFAQAAGPRLSYLAFEPPAPKGEAILVHADSPIASVADLKGKKIALNKGSNVHYLLVKALESAGLAYEDVETVFLPPADARPAFETKAVDAWAIWDPFLASAESALGAKVLANAEGLAPNYQFYLGDRSFLEGNADAAKELIAAIAEVGAWITSNPDAAAAELSPTTGIPEEVLKSAISRQSFGVAPINDQVVADQQAVADTFLKLGLLPNPVTVADAVAKIS
ncbi:sulfonate ABC transporter substrate-binding protein [Paragemmobacter straminiformis]|uniref:Putative aliphatic sulfonates-binding protein n=1 Tax=Paragemmobacter straminiformis TaxID=2045119 RepID=A0A842ICK1_9RHOB|nr:sulfonate ABC transporter substrate-binding protein [Gemmobacter straminiformis]MBC2836834.1 sulfonate ABC transporter substrate-binding protein [Gemmobacter straminiformis]